MRFQTKIFLRTFKIDSKIVFVGAVLLSQFKRPKADVNFIAMRLSSFPLPFPLSLTSAI